MCMCGKVILKELCKQCDKRGWAAVMLGERGMKYLNGAKTSQRCIHLTATKVALH